MTGQRDESLDASLRHSLTARTCTLSEVDDWLRTIEAGGEFSVESRSIDRLDKWSIDPDTHDVSHASGRFFAIRGVDVSVVHDGIETRWQQPVIEQPDVGILGLVTAEIDGALHALVQAKMEPGNRRLVQVSPTVQATASNFERVHRGSAIPYLEYFQADQPGHVTTLVDELQTEQATRYLRKRNRNAIVVVKQSQLESIDDRFRWMTFADLTALAMGDDLLHMDTRSILGSLPMTRAMGAAHASGVAREVEDWLSGLVGRTAVHTRPISLRDVRGWELSSGRIASAEPSPFTVVGVRVTATHREVGGWDQPLVHNADGARVTLLVRRMRGRTEVLTTAATGMGVREGVELGPSIVEWPPGEREVVLDHAASEVTEAADRGSVVFDSSLPEEGGRFFHSSVRHRIIEVVIADDVPDNDARKWLDLQQLRALGSTTSLLNMELRSLLACLPMDLRDED